MVEGGCRLRLAVEPALEHGIFRQHVGEKLQGDDIARLAVGRLVDGGHAPATELVVQVVAIAGPRLTQRRPGQLECRGDDALDAAGRVGLLRAGQERFHLEPERQVAGHGHLEEPGALGGREIDALVEEHFDPLALGGIRDHRL